MAGRKVFAPATVLTAADVNNFLMDQAVMVFADSTARGSAIPTPTEGMVTYLEDTNALEVFTGASFVPVAEEADLTTLIPKSTVTTAGDLIVADGAGSVTRLGIGAADTVLTSDGTTLSFQAGGTGSELYAAGSHTVSKDAGHYLIDTDGTGPFLAGDTSLTSGINNLSAFNSITVSFTPNGIVWTSRTSGFGTTSIENVAYGDGLFVAVGGDGKLTTSPDGITWTARTSGFGTTGILGVAYDERPGGLWVAVGRDGKLTTSPDGITWTSRTSGFGTTNIADVAVDTRTGGLWVIVGQNGTLSTSPDTITWTSRTSGFGSNNIRGIEFADGLFVIVGNDGNLATSPDGITWTSRTSGFGTTSIGSVAYDTRTGGLWVIVGGSGTLATSPDAITWTLRTSGFGTTSINGVAYGDGLFVAVANSGVLATSEDEFIDSEAVLLLTELPTPIQP